MEDTTKAGAWGTFATSWVGGAKLFGDKTALKAIKEGEEHGIGEYQEMLADKSLTPALKRVINQQLLPAQHAHIKTIHRSL